MEIKNIVIDYIKDLHIENKRMNVMKELLKKGYNDYYSLLEDNTLTLIIINDIDNINVYESYIIDLLDNEYYYKILNDVWVCIDDNIYNIDSDIYTDIDDNYYFDIRKYLFNTFNIKICNCGCSKKSISWTI